MFTALFLLSVSAQAIVHDGTIPKGSRMGNGGNIPAGANKGNGGNIPAGANKAGAAKNQVVAANRQLFRTDYDDGFEDSWEDLERMYGPNASSSTSAPAASSSTSSTSAPDASSSTSSTSAPDASSSTPAPDPSSSTSAPDAKDLEEKLKKTIRSMRHYDWETLPLDGFSPVFVDVIRTFQYAAEHSDRFHAENVLLWFDFHRDDDEVHKFYKNFPKQQKQLWMSLYTLVLVDAYLVPEPVLVKKKSLKGAKSDTKKEAVKKGLDKKKADDQIPEESDEDEDGIADEDVFASCFPQLEPHEVKFLKDTQNAIEENNKPMIAKFIPQIKPDWCVEYPMLITWVTHTFSSVIHDEVLEQIPEKEDGSWSSGDFQNALIKVDLKIKININMGGNESTEEDSAQQVSGDFKTGRATTCALWATAFAL